MIPVSLTEIEEKHLTALIDQGRREDRTIEYKADWPSNKASDRVPVIESVASFANELGGDLVIGVRAEGGLPVALPGVEAIDADAMCVQLDQAIRADVFLTYHSARATRPWTLCFRASRF